MTPERFKVLSAEEFCKGPLTGTPRIAHAYHDTYAAAVARRDWKTVNAANDARAKRLIAEWSQENDLPHPLDEPEAEPAAALAANRVQSAAEFMGALKPREWFIEDLQPLDAQLCVIYGDSTVGKSFFMIDVAGAIHRGVRWNGRETHKGRVIYLCAEGAGDFRYRLHAYCKAHGGVKAEDLPLIIDNAPDLFDIKSAASVIEQILTVGGCDVLIIDTLSATFTGNENGSEMGVYWTNIKRIRKACCRSVWVVAHCGKDASKGIRGWSGTRAALDVELEVTQTDQGLRTARLTKTKGTAGGAQWNFRLAVTPLGTDRNGKTYDSCVVQFTQEQAPAVAAKIGANQQYLIDARKELGAAASRHDIIDLAYKRKCASAGRALNKKTERGNLGRAFDQLEEAARPSGVTSATKINDPFEES